MNNNQLLPLIVDFPIQSKVDGFRNRVSIPQVSVSFAPTTEMKFIEFPSEPSSLFYTSEETRLFKIRAARDGRLAAMMIGLDHVPEDEEEYWIGIEKYLSRDVAMRSVVCRRDMLIQLYRGKTNVQSRNSRPYLKLVLDQPGLWHID